MVLYAIIIVIGIGGIAWGVWRYLRNRVPIVKAGNIDVFQWRYSTANKKDKPQYIYVGRDQLNTDHLQCFLVRGESMHEYGIHNNDYVFVRNLDAAGKVELKYEKPVVLFKVHDSDHDHMLRDWKFWESHYKLRKFISYIYLNPQEAQPNERVFEELYNRHSYEISISRKDFVDYCKNRIKELGLDTNYVLSETYDCQLGRNRYSIHGVSNLIGKIECNIPRQS